MSLQVVETPKCISGHGRMVPIGYEMCFAPSDGLVTTTVEYISTKNGIIPWGYAISDEAREALPVGDHMGDEIADLKDDGKLVSFYRVMNAGDGYLRIDDNRPGHNWGYMVWRGTRRKPGVSFIPGAVYHWFDDKVEKHRFPRLTEFKDVVALLLALSVVFAADTLSIATMELVDNAVMVTIPRAMDSGLLDPLFWAAMLLSLCAAFVAAYPVNRYLLSRGKGHALIMKYHDHGTHEYHGKR